MPDRTSVRLFLALWPSPSERDACAALRDAITWNAGARPIADDRLHVTLHFIGPVARDRVDVLADTFDGAGRAFAATFDHCAIWPNGIAALESSRVPHALMTLRAELGERLRASALPVEARAFRPHVTLARDARGSVPPAAFEPVGWRATDYVLAESPGGPYRILRRYPLG